MLCSNSDVHTYSLQYERNNHDVDYDNSSAVMYCCVQYAGYGIPVVLVSNDCGLEKQREVSEVEGIAMAARIGAAFLKVNAKTGHNIMEVLTILL